MADPRIETIRRCARCHQHGVTCVDATRFLLQGIIPSGTTYQHACGACGYRFKTESPWRTVVSLLMAAIPFALFVLMVVVAIPYVVDPDLPHQRAGQNTIWIFAGIAALFLLLSLGVMGSSAWRTIQLYRNPAVGRASDQGSPK